MGLTGGRQWLLKVSLCITFMLIPSSVAMVISHSNDVNRLLHGEKLITSQSLVVGVVGVDRPPAALAKALAAFRVVDGGCTGTAAAASAGKAGRHAPNSAA